FNSSLDSYAQALREYQPVEEAPKKGWFAGSKPKAADAPPPTPPAAMVEPREQAEHNAAGHPAAPFIVGGAVAGGVGALAADHFLHPDHGADAATAPVSPEGEDDYQFAPDSSVPPVVPLSPPPP